MVVLSLSTSIGSLSPDVLGPSDWSSIVNLTPAVVRRHECQLNQFIRSNGKRVLEAWEGSPEVEAELALIVTDVQRALKLKPGRIDKRDEQLREGLLIVIILELHNQITVPYLQGFLGILLNVKRSRQCPLSSAGMEDMKTSPSGVEASLIFQHLVGALVPIVPPRLRFKNACWVLNQSQQFNDDTLSIVGIVDPHLAHELKEKKCEDMFTAWVGSQIANCLTSLLTPDFWQRTMIHIEVLAKGLDIKLSTVVGLVAVVLFNHMWRAQTENDHNDGALEEVLGWKDSFPTKICMPAAFAAINTIWNPRISQLLKQMSQHASLCAPERRLVRRTSPK
eukprot:Blabericola_migrator_1__4795@NODE_251_length_10854_cov_130_762121_g212_i0_p5_GENE_NODE_251_length_10854_cov_130_762121_g212_i0NODE_251_length_10854_cov_130_762121_g212_i0_p5_ORF_typecomplete_len336_score42_06_NODE_251_length_10854_cov_130_762121_g212_i017532760